MFSIGMGRPLTPKAGPPADVCATTTYGVPLAAAVQRGHVFGTQFHPEKSSRAGWKILKNFLAC